MPKAVENENDISAVKRLSPSQLFAVSGKRVLVTGGGSGIGAMCAMGFVGGGAEVIICSRKDISKFASEISNIGPGSCTSMKADLSTDEGVEEFVNAFKERYDSLDALINNSGTNWSEPMESYPMKAWDKVYALNVKAVFNLTRSLVPLLETASKNSGEHSAVINISSIESIQVPILYTYAYGSGKAAVNQLSKVLAGHLADKNITVNAVLPGPFRSRMMRATIEAATEEGIAKGTAIGRIGREEDMAGICVYLVSRAGSFVTGATIPVDGGSLVHVKSAI